MPNRRLEGTQTQLLFPSPLDLTSASAPPNSLRPTGQPPNPQRPTGQHNAGFNAVNHLLGLTNDDYLHALPEKEAFAQLIDCFRMRMEDEYTYGQNNIGIYAEENPVPVFKRFLDLAESRPGLLPPWWNAAKRRECETMAVDSNGYQLCHREERYTGALQQ